MLTVIHRWAWDGVEIRPCAHNLKLCLFAKKNCQQVLRSKVENSNFAYVKLCLYCINIPGFQRQIDLIRVNFKQTHDEVGPNNVKYPTHDELGFLESKYKLIMSSDQ